MVALWAVTAWRDDSLLTANGVRSILLLSCPLAIFAASQTVCMLTGGIDLSIAMTANLAAYVAATQSDRGPWIAIAFALGIGVVGRRRQRAGDRRVQGEPADHDARHGERAARHHHGRAAGLAVRLDPTSSTSSARWVRSALVGPLPKNAIVWAAIALLLIFGLRSSGLGRTIYAVGDNPIACRFAGVRVWQVLLAVYVLAGVFAAIGGLLFSGTTGSVGVDQTNSYLLPSVAATVIGGTSILGGVGGYGGTILGAIILTLLNRLLLRLDTSEAFKQMLYGAIVLALAWVYVRLSGQRATAGTREGPSPSSCTGSWPPVARNRVQERGCARDLT